MHAHYRHIFVLMQRVQDAVIDGYDRYQFIHCSATKAAQLSRQFAAEYETEISKQARYRRKMAGIARARFFSVEEDGIVTGFLMATEGKGLIGRETMHDPTKKRIAVGSYELVHDGVGWSWRFTQEAIKQWRKRIHDAIARDNLAQLLTTIRHLYRSAGFRIVRKQIGQLANYIRGEWRRLRKGAPPDLPTFLYYMRRLPDDWTPAGAVPSAIARGRPQKPHFIELPHVQSEN
ncbi:hypothetical protein [Paraburkholderia kururiensis]|uniref:hypothetical protein n=1 Tax=Paraburkholderia kururiensis TaxID=984307 RepID=UPI000F898F4F|nr:hypothetical protein [Paraburkholderia kururiensis]